MRSFFLALVFPLAAFAQDVTVMDYTPRSTLVVPETNVTRAAYPFVDAHAHLWQAGEMSAEEIATLVAEMDAMNMAVLVNLSGGSGEALRSGIENVQRHAPGRVVFFANVDFDAIAEPGWSERAAAQLEADVMKNNKTRCYANGQPQHVKGKEPLVLC